MPLIGRDFALHPSLQPVKDLLASMNGNTTFTGISASGNAVWLPGQSTVPYQVGASGAGARVPPVDRTTR